MAGKLVVAYFPAGLNWGSPIPEAAWYFCNGSKGIILGPADGFIAGKLGSLPVQR
jgi:hypothetical protein